MNVNCSECSNRIFIVYNILQKEIFIDRNEVLKMESYIEYAKTDEEVKGYTKYTIKERMMDENNNIMLICSETHEKFE